MPAMSLLRSQKIVSTSQKKQEDIPPLLTMLHPLFEDLIVVLCHYETLLSESR